MENGSQFFEIILYALIAVFLILRLRSVLGKRDGHEGGYHDPFRRNKQDQAESDNDDNVVHLPSHPETDQADDLSEDVYGYVDDDESEEEVLDENDPLSAGIIQICLADPSFDQKEFVSGARIAFEVILGAYAVCDTGTLKGLLSSEVYENFKGAIENRSQAGETLEETLVGIKSAQIVEAFMDDDDANVTVKFVSEQIMAVRDEAGDIIEGSPDKIVANTDYWTFSRDTRNSDPNWILVATASQE